MPTALVTGASRGIGRAVTVELANRGWRVVAAMRNPADGADLASDLVEVVRLDVTDSSTYVVPSDLTLLVNNAGADSVHTPLEHTDVETWRAMYETNVFGMAALTAACIQTLRANAPSTVAVFTSGSIFTPVPFYTGYRGSKAAASAICDSLRAELTPRGVRVVEIVPGPVESDMYDASRAEPDAAQFPDYREQALAGWELKKASADTMVEPAAKAAVAIVDALTDVAGQGAKAPMRYSCDPLGIGLLAMWRSSDDETIYHLMNPA